jgi:rhodanese-related sulfurtransferase
MKGMGFVLTALALFICCAAVALAAEKPGEPFTVVTSGQLKSMIDRDEPGLLLIDTRTTGEYQEAHIKGALSIPWARLEKDTSVLNFPRESALLFYCNGLA